MAGFSFSKSRDGNTDIIRDDLQMAASATITAGDALEFANGKLQRANAQADTPEYVALEGNTTTSTSLVKPKVIEVGRSTFTVPHTPLINDVAVNSGSTTTVLCALADGSSSDMVGGVVYFPEQNEHRIITANTYSSNVVTITFVEPLPRAAASGDTVRATAFGPGTRAVKLDSSNPHKAVSSARADVSGGSVRIRKVDLKNRVLEVYFRD